MTRGNILLVDDDPGFLTALAKTLAKRRYTVTTAACGAGAVEEMTGRKEKFDVVITDLLMPIISGLTVMKAAKVAFPRVPVILITAFGDEENQRNALRQGAFAFVRKPLNSGDFISLIDSAIKAERQKNGMSDAAARR
jgi:DNA-binding NtrC family response regulator